MAQLTKDSLKSIINSSYLISGLVEADLTRLGYMLDNIVKQNDIKELITYGSFIYLGDIYYGSNPLANTHHPRLHSDLYDDMNTYLEQCSTLINNCYLINQTIFRLLKGCTNYQEIRNALPDCLMNYDTKDYYRNLPRTEPLGSNIKGDAIAEAQLEKLLPLMDYYSGLHLMI